jgi:hypothetical protein
MLYVYVPVCYKHTAKVRKKRKKSKREVEIGVLSLNVFSDIVFLNRAVIMS